MGAQRTRVQLGHSARALIDRRGYAATTAADIAAEAGVSERTFFRHFASKADVVLDGEAAQRDRLVALLAAQSPGTDPLGDLGVVAVRFVREVLEPESDRVRWRCTTIGGDDELTAAARNRFERWAEPVAGALAHRAGGDRAGPSDWVRARVLLELIAQAVSGWLRAQEPAQMSEVAEQVIDEALRGLTSRT